MATDTPESASAWLVEQYQKNVLHFWTGRYQSGQNRWSTSSSDAVRFARKADADVILLDLCGGLGRTAEHVFGLQISGDTHG